MHASINFNRTKAELSSNYTRKLGEGSYLLAERARKGGGLKLTFSLVSSHPSNLLNKIVSQQHSRDTLVQENGPDPYLQDSLKFKILMRNSHIKIKQRINIMFFYFSRFIIVWFGQQLFDFLTVQHSLPKLKQNKSSCYSRN